MSDWVIILLVCGAYLALTLAMGIGSRRTVSTSVAGYVAGDRTLGVVVLYFVLGASVFSSFAFLGAPGWAYSRGAAAFYVIAYGVVGMVPFYFLGPRARRVGAEHGFVTQAELLAHRYDSRILSVLLAVLSVAVFVPYLTLQMKGAGYILSTISEGMVPQWAGALVAYGVVLVYVFTSGVMGIGWTNTFQGLFMLAVAWFLGLYLPNELHGGVQAMFEKIAASGNESMLTAPGLAADGSRWSWSAYSTAVIVSAVGFSMWPHLFMKAYTAESERTLKLTVVLYPTFQLFLVPVLLIGFAGILAYPNVSPPDTIVPHMLAQIELSPLLVGLVCAGALAASMSSGDAILHAAASIGLRDGVRPVLSAVTEGTEASAGMSDGTQRRWIQALVVVISATAYYFAVFSDAGIVALLLGAYGGVAQIFPLMAGAFYWPRATGPGALAGLLAGVGVNTLFLVMPELKPFPLHEGVYGLVANVAAFVSVSLATHPLPRHHLTDYCEALDPSPPEPQPSE
jgi:SSS family solute:Na+ symporter